MTTITVMTNEDLLKAIKASEKRIIKRLDQIEEKLMPKSVYISRKKLFLDTLPSIPNMGSYLTNEK
jgi:transcription initiation factor IIE alpha subunit